jgi:hypothetical protein
MRDQRLDKVTLPSGVEGEISTSTAQLFMWTATKR